MKMNITMDPKNKKRREDRTFYNDSDSDYETRTMTMNWPRFVLVESGDESLPVTKLSEQGVILVKRIRRKEEGQDKDTNTLFLTFCNANLPKDIRIGYLRVKVDPCVPNPLRCFKCQKYGHGAQRCSSAAVCPKCALEHEGPCTNPPPPPPPPQVREV